MSYPIDDIIFGRNGQQQALRALLRAYSCPGSSSAMAAEMAAIMGGVTTETGAAVWGIAAGADLGAADAAVRLQTRACRRR